MNDSERDGQGTNLAVITSRPIAPAAAWTEIVKRAADVVAAAGLLALLAPVFLVVAAAVAASSRGPVLYVQHRVGRDGRLFPMRKFRSMVADSDARIDADPALRTAKHENGFKLPAGNALETPVGRVLRRTSLDELPQLFNVLVGQMSLVGVRPIEPGELERRSDVDRLAYLHRRPGLTGLWQVSGRSRLTYEQRCALDHEYVTTWSLIGDLKILARTPLAVLRTGDTG